MKSVLYSLIIFAMSFSLHAQVGIGTTTPNGALEITSSNNGLLIPRVALISTTDITTVVTGTESELVYNTTLASGMTDVSPGFYYLSAPGGPWVRLGETSSSPPPPPPPPVDAGWSLTGNAGIVDGTNFLGTTTAVDVVFRRDDTESGRISDDVTFFGVDSGLNNLAGGDNNTALGVESLRDNQTGDSNTAVGFGAFRNTTVGNNTGLGFDAGAPCTSGTGNTAIGTQALRVLSQGDNNVSVGYLSGNISVGSNNITIGYNAQVGNPSNDNQVRIGDTNVLVIAGQVGFTNASDRRFKDNIEDSGLGLDFLKTLRPVSYFRKNDENKKTEYGFIAQELEQSLIDAGDKNNSIISISDNGMYGVRYNDFISITIKAVQEQQGLIEQLQKDNEELKAVNAAILKRLEALENK